MVFRLLIAIILFSCGAQFVSAGVISAADSFEFKSTSNSMSVPNHSDDQTVDIHLGDGFAMSKAIVNSSTFVTLAVIEYSELEFNVVPEEVGSRWRLRNQTLPASPFTQCLLKPS